MVQCDIIKETEGNKNGFKELFYSWRTKVGYDFIALKDAHQSMG